MGRGASRGTYRHSGRRDGGLACLCLLGPARGRRGAGLRGAGLGGRGRRSLFVGGCGGCLRRSRTRGLGDGHLVVCGEEGIRVRRIGGVRAEYGFFAGAWRVGRRNQSLMSRLFVDGVGVLLCVSVS